jgi:hypothetical protein
LRYSPPSPPYNRTGCTTSRESSREECTSEVGQRKSAGLFPRLSVTSSPLLATGVCLPT